MELTVIRDMPAKIERKIRRICRDIIDGYDTDACSIDARDIIEWLAQAPTVGPLPSVEIPPQSDRYTKD